MLRRVMIGGVSRGQARRLSAKSSRALHSTTRLLPALSCRTSKLCLQSRLSCHQVPRARNEGNRGLFQCNAIHTRRSNQHSQSHSRRHSSAAGRQRYAVGLAGVAVAVALAAAADEALGEEEAMHFQFTSKEALSEFDGRDHPDVPKGEGPIFLAIQGIVFDVTESRGMYGPEGPYHFFAGTDASRCLAKDVMSAKELDTPDDPSFVGGLNEEETQTLDSWYRFFLKKYRIIGVIAQDRAEYDKKLASALSRQQSILKDDAATTSSSSSSSSSTRVHH